MTPKPCIRTLFIEDCFNVLEKGSARMRIIDNVYLLDSSKGSYIYIIRDEEVVLVDTGLPFKRKSIIREIESLGIDLKDIKHILLTHHDIDHIGNLFDLQQLTGAKVWASKEDIPYICGNMDRHGFKKYLKHIFKIKVPKGINPYISNSNINGIKVIPTPGHTPGHVCLLYRDILFAGDLLENKHGKLRPYPAAWNWNQSAMKGSINKISDIPYKWLCPAHGKPVEKRMISIQNLDKF